MHSRQSHPFDGISWLLNRTRINSPESVKKDLTRGDERPEWPLSTYGPAKHEPTYITGTDLSQEEMRVRAYDARSQNRFNEYVRTMHVPAVRAGVANLANTTDYIRSDPATTSRKHYHGPFERFHGYIQTYYRAGFHRPDRCGQLASTSNIGIWCSNDPGFWLYRLWIKCRRHWWRHLHLRSSQAGRIWVIHHPSLRPDKHPKCFWPNILLRSRNYIHLCVRSNLYSHAGVRSNLCIRQFHRLETSDFRLW